MADLEIRNLHVNADDKRILNGLDLEISRGEVHALMGPNGSGKSTLANTIMGHPALEVTEGQIDFNGEEITEADPEERSRAGLFLAFQYPVAIPGVTVAKYLRMAINAHREARGEPQISLKEFRRDTEAAMEMVDIPREFSSRYVNDGFSGGEKKRLEILQLAMLRPQIAVLDETDSGLDIDALRIVAEGVNTFSGPDMGVLIITHYQRILHLVEPDFVHVMFDGRIVKQGGPELVTELEDKGYGWIQRGGRSRGMSGPSPLVPRLSSLDVERVRAAFPALSREVHGRPVAYLDSGASAQRVLASIQAVDRYERRHHANVHRGSHTLSAEATAAYEGARATVADHLGAADRREVVFVRNATEAINLVARAWGDANVGDGDRIVLTEMEHHSNIVPWQQLAARTGAVIDWVGVDDDGLLDLDGYAKLLERGPKLVAVAHVSNVLGTENPLAEISRLAHEAGALVLADGAQAAPKLALDVPELGIDFYALTGHKAYAPTGIGALWARHELLVEMPPFLGGGSMIRKVTKAGTTWADPPAKFEAGTPAIAQAIGLAAAFRWLDSLGMDAATAHEREIAGYTLERLASVPGLRVFGPPASPTRLGPVSFELEGIHGHDVAEILDRHGVAVRAGHHCAQPLMNRFGIAATARASFGIYTTRDEIDRLVEGLDDARHVFGLD